jgi:DNA polymerase gamma 1
MGTTFLPVNSNWEKYIKSSENAFENLQKEVKSILILKANEALRLLENEK